MKLLCLLPILFLLQGCLPSGEEVPAVPEAFQTGRIEADNIDSPAVWHGPQGEHWLIATAKGTHQLVVCDAADGRFLRRVGSEGAAPGQFNRPNGISVHRNLVFVVERDNRRVQVLGLPGFEPLGSLGEERLRKPYGLWVTGDAHEGQVYVSDNHDPAPDHGLDQRIQVYGWRIEDRAFRGKHLRAIGESEGPGALQVAESVFGDPVYDRLLLSEEDTQQSSLKVFDLQGRFSGEVIGLGIFRNQVEGIALWDQGEGEGLWLVSDQHRGRNVFRAFDRRSLSYRGAFRGPATQNTDGVWLTTKAYGPFPQGAFFAVHDDGNVSAFDLRAIADVLRLP